MAQIICENLSIGYESGPVLQNIDFCVNKGDFLCIIGENGSGKTTLIKTVSGLIPLKDGTITFGDGLERNEIGYMPQQSAVQKDFPASVEEIVLSGFQNKMGLNPFYTASMKQTALTNMKKMNIENLLRSCYRNLSGGQQQRVLIARALCAASKVLLLDEPTSGLDPNVTHEMYKLISDINKTDGITVIMVSHDVKTAISFASHVLYIGNGTFFGTKQQYLESAIPDRFGGGDMK